MQLIFKIKHYFFSAFRELFVYNHNSLEFRAKLFALIIAADENAKVENYEIINDIGMKIYNNDKDRVKLLMLSTKELLKKIRDNNGLNIDSLILNIQKELKFVPRYAKKIDIDSLKTLIGVSHDRDTISYQENILEFLKRLKEEILHEQQDTIAKEEEKIESKY